MLKKQGQSFGPGFDYDYCVIISRNFYAGIYDINNPYSDAFIMVNGKDNVSTKALIDELEGVMRQVRRLSQRRR